MLHSIPARVTSNAPVSGGQDVSVLVQLDVTQIALGDVTAGGTLDVDAETGSIVMANGALSDAGGNIHHGLPDG